MTSAPSKLPSYSWPPVVEVAVGVHFLQLPGLTALPLVQMASTWADRYPTVEERSPLPPVFSSSGAMPGFHLGTPPVRLWLLSADESVLLQIQRDRLLLNWRKLTPADEYPRYDRLREEFTTCWVHFSTLVGEHEEYGTLQPALAEVTFLNHVSMIDPAQLGDTLQPLRPGWVPAEHFSTVLQVEQQLYDEEGNPRGHQSIGASYSDGGLQLEVTSRTSLDGYPSDMGTILDALDVAHNAGVVSFDHVTTEQAHKVWGKQ